MIAVERKSNANQLSYRMEKYALKPIQPKDLREIIDRCSFANFSPWIWGLPRRAWDNGMPQPRTLALITFENQAVLRTEVYAAWKELGGTEATLPDLFAYGMDDYSPAREHRKIIAFDRYWLSEDSHQDCYPYLIEEYGQRSLDFVKCAQIAVWQSGWWFARILPFSTDT